MCFFVVVGKKWAVCGKRGTSVKQSENYLKLFTATACRDDLPGLNSGFYSQGQALPVFE